MKIIDKIKKRIWKEPSCLISTEPPRPKYSAVMHKKHSRVDPMYTAGRPDLFMVKADIIDNDIKEVVKVSTGYFNKLEDYELGLKALTQKIEEDIKDLHKKNRLEILINKAIIDTQIALDGLVWFWK